jgi:hypothetical protein
MIHKEHRFERSSRDKEQSQSKTAFSSGRGKEKEMRDVKVLVWLPVVDALQMARGRSITSPFQTIDILLCDLRSESSPCLTLIFHLHLPL